MKGFFKWFNNKAKIKRWILLILIGISLVCFGIAKLITRKTLNVTEIIIIIVSFIIGFTAVVLGLVYMQKRMLELLVEESDTRKESNNVNTLIFNKKVYNQGPKIVVIGGGSGLNTVLRGLKNYTDNITAIVTVSDYGETPTDSRKALKVLPLNDIKESLVALAYDEKEMEKLLNVEFDDGKLKSLSFSDIYFLAMDKVYGNFAKSIEQSKSVFNMTGTVLPVTLEPISICAELEDGTVVENREKIPEIVAQTTNQISRVYISPTNTKPAPGVIDAIKEADAIIIGPGSLYTNVIPNLLVKGIAKAVKDSKAIKVYISNIMTEMGQTDEYNLSDHIKTIVDYVGEGIIDYCIYDTGEIIPEFIHKYNEEGKDIVIPDVQKAKQYGVKLIQRNLSNIEDDKVRHDSDVIASTIIQLVCDELKFEDMQNDSQYMMLNSKLKESKRKIHKRERAEKKFRKSGRKQFERRDDDSKFKLKYKDRIKAIKESDKNIEEKKKKAGKSRLKKIADIDSDSKYKDIISKQETAEVKLFDAVSQIGIIKNDNEELNKEDKDSKELEEIQARKQEEIRKKLDAKRKAVAKSRQIEAKEKMKEKKEKEKRKKIEQARKQREKKEKERLRKNKN